ncbi:MAG: DUF4423 domain-containing protein [Oligoflexus sp.]
MSKFQVFRYQCYRELIRDYARFKSLSYRSLATAAHIHTSYFSRVMAGATDFSADQIFKITKAMQIQEHEIEYILLLGEWSRASHHEHGSFIKKRIEYLQEEYCKLADQLQGIAVKLDEDAIKAYYSDIRLAKVHMLLMIPRYQQNLRLVARQLRISETELQKLLQQLHQLDVICWEKGRLRRVKSSVHLDEHHPISLLNHKNWRIDALQHLNTCERKPSDYHFSATFTCDESTKIKIKDILKAAIIQAQKLVADCPCDEESYALTIDLYQS